VSFRFNGDSLALIVRRGDYRAYTFVMIDGKPANLLPKEPRGAYLIMTSPGRYPVIETIPVANNLGPGEHTAEVYVDRGWNQWALIGWSSRSIFDFRFQILDWVAVAIGVASAIALVAFVPRAHWGQWFKERWALTYRPSSVVRRPFTWQAILLGLIAWLTASLTWAQDAATAYRNLGTAPQVALSGLISGVLFWSPVFVLSLIALAALFVLVLLRVEVGLMLLAFFIPFYLIPQRLFAYAFSMVELLTLMCAVSWAIRKLEIRDWRFNLQSPIPNLSLFDWSVLAFVIISLVSASQASFRVEAFREFRLVIVEPALLYVMLRTLPRDAQGRNWLFNVVDGYVLGAVTISMIGLVNYALGNTVVAEFGLPRIKSVFGSPNNDALYLERALPVLLAAVLWGKWRLEIGDWSFNLQSPISNPLVVRRTLYAIGLIPVILALVLSQSRGALLLGVPAAVIVMCLLAGGRWRWLGFGLLALVVLAFVVVLSGVAAPLLEGTRFASALDLNRGTGFFRMNLWQSALNMWRDHALLGVGPDNFLYAYRSFYILPAAWQEPNLSHPHNIAFDFAARLGTLGLLAGIGLIAGYIQLVRRIFKIERAYAIGFAGLLAAMLAHGLVDNAFFLIDLAFAFMLTAGVMAQLTMSGDIRRFDALTT
jgi:O-antigen ligase